MEPQNYTIRLQAVEELAKNFPGSTSGTLGLWAGIYIQTTWQKDSGRNRFGAWHLVNQYLTLYPFELLKNPSKKTGVYIERAWRNYFAHAKHTGTVRDTLRASRKLWHAHNSSIRHALRVHQKEIAEMNQTLPWKEVLFWHIWVRVVLTSELLSPPTTDFLLRRLLTSIMPAHSPLGR